MKKIAILDAVPTEYIPPSNPLTDAEKFLTLFQEVALQAEFTVYNLATDPLPTDVHQYDAYLITGSPLGVHDVVEWIQQLLQFIRLLNQYKKKLVGICFGHQAITQALGGEVARAEGGWLVGVSEITLHNFPSWMQPNVSSCQIYHINQDQAIKLPSGAELIASSAHCPLSMYTIEDHIFCMQGHPEQPLDSMLAIMEVLKERIPSQVFNEAIQSLGLSVDRALVGEWIRKFILEDY
ncbi:MAG: glutamine amidotransferase-related protein [Phototrophicaceae bacterium]